MANRPFLDRVILPASTASEAPINIPPGTSPTTPVNGDLWWAAASIYAYVSGAVWNVLGWAKNVGQAYNSDVYGVPVLNTGFSVGEPIDTPVFSSLPFGVMALGVGPAGGHASAWAEMCFSYANEHQALELRGIADYDNSTLPHVGHMQSRILYYGENFNPAASSNLGSIADPYINFASTPGYSGTKDFVSDNPNNPDPWTYFKIDMWGESLGQIQANSSVSLIMEVYSDSAFSILLDTQVGTSVISSAGIPAVNNPGETVYIRITADTGGGVPPVDYTALSTFLGGPGTTYSVSASTSLQTIFWNQVANENGFQISYSLSSDVIASRVVLFTLGMDDATPGTATASLVPKLSLTDGARFLTTSAPTAEPSVGHLWFDSTLNRFVYNENSGPNHVFGVGDVTSVGLAGPAQFAILGSPVTGSGTLTFAWNNQSANQVLAGPASGSSAAPTFRSLVPADLAIPYIQIRDEQASGTDGGTFTSGSWQTRVLNTEVADTAGIATLASNQITLPAGTYEACATAPTFATFSMLRIQDITNGVTLARGATTSNAAGDGNLDLSQCSGRFTLAGTTAIEVQHRCVSTTATVGLGAAASFGVNEIYAEIILRKVA